MHELHSMRPAADFLEKQPYPFQKFGLASARHAMEEHSARFTSDIELLLFIVPFLKAPVDDVLQRQPLLIRRYYCVRS